MFNSFVDECLPLRRIRAACDACGVDLAEEEAFLGAGAMGRVFAVTCRSDAQKRAALKIVTRDHEYVLQHEAQRLVAAEALDFVVNVVKSFTILPSNLGAAIVISPVGIPLDRESLLDDGVIHRVVHLLQRLHSAGIVHGDPRLANIIVVNDDLVWIDLAHLMRWQHDSFSIDMEVLCRSLLHIDLEVSLQDSLRAALKSYDRSSARANDIADQVARLLPRESI